MSAVKQEMTPGPWARIRDTTGYHLVTAGRGQLVVLSSLVAASADDWDAPGHSYLCARRDAGASQLVPLTPDHPDARLICASPDLLDVLRALVAFDPAVMFPMRPQHVAPQEWRQWGQLLAKAEALGSQLGGKP